MGISRSISSPNGFRIEERQIMALHNILKLGFVPVAVFLFNVNLSKPDVTLSIHFEEVIVSILIRLIQYFKGFLPFVIEIGPE